MAVMVTNAIGGGVDRLVRWVILPVTGVIPFLVRTGLLFAGFAVLWLAFFAALVTAPGTLDAAWEAIAGLHLLVQGVVWLLFLPLVGGLWVWNTDWSLVVRVALVVGIAGWNLIVFMPRRETTSTAVSNQG